MSLKLIYGDWVVNTVEKIDIVKDICDNLCIRGISSFSRRNNNFWVFGEWFGKKCCDNSMYLANYVADNIPHIKAIWIAKEGTNTEDLNPSVKVVRYGSAEAQRYIQKSKVFFMGQNFNDFTPSGQNYFGGAITVNLWHGVMWKRLGTSLADRSILIKTFYKLFFRAHEADFFISPSEKYSTAIMEAFGVKKDNIILSGLPRNTIFYNPNIVAKYRSEIIDNLEKHIGKKLDGSEHLVVYMPTFRDKESSAFSFTKIDSGDFHEWLVSNNIYIIQKAHFVSIERNDSLDQGDERIININDVSAQKLLAAADMLVTDYSSCFFDYLLTDRPIIHYLYDYEYYKDKDRGLYYSYKDVCCGDVAFKESELKNLLEVNFDRPERKKDLRAIRRKQYITYESDNACRDICNYVMRKLRK